MYLGVSLSRLRVLLQGFYQIWIDGFYSLWYFFFSYFGFEFLIGAEMLMSMEILEGKHISRFVSKSSLLSPNPKVMPHVSTASLLFFPRTLACIRLLDLWWLYGRQCLACMASLFLYVLLRFLDFYFRERYNPLILGFFRERYKPLVYQRKIQSLKLRSSLDSKLLGLRIVYDLRFRRWQGFGYVCVSLV